MKSKLQKPDQDILEAYMMVDEVVGNIKSVRKNIDSDFQVWYIHSILRNRSNIPS